MAFLLLFVPILTQTLQGQRKRKNEKEKGTNQKEKRKAKKKKKDESRGPVSVARTHPTAP